MQMDPVALELDVVVILGRNGWQRPEQRCYVKDDVADAADGFLARALPGWRMVLRP